MSSYSYIFNYIKRHPEKFKDVIQRNDLDGLMVQLINESINIADAPARLSRAYAEFQDFFKEAFGQYAQAFVPMRSVVLGGAFVSPKITSGEITEKALVKRQGIIREILKKYGYKYIIIKENFDAFYIYDIGNGKFYREGTEEYSKVESKAETVHISKYNRQYIDGVPNLRKRGYLILNPQSDENEDGCALAFVCEDSTNPLIGIYLEIPKEHWR